MLAFLWILIITLLLVLVMTNTVSPVVALVVVPVLTTLQGGFNTEMFTFMTEGVQAISTTGVMLIFAILYFSILADAGVCTFRNGRYRKYF